MLWHRDLAFRRWPFAGGKRQTVALAGGDRVHDIPEATGNRESIVRRNIRGIFREFGVTRQAELVRLVPSPLGHIRD